MKRTLSTIAIVCLSMLMLTGCFFGNPNEDKKPREPEFILQNETIGEQENLALYLTDYEPNCTYTVKIDGEAVSNASEAYWPSYVAAKSSYALKTGTHKVEVIESDRFDRSLGVREFTVTDSIGIRAYITDEANQGLPKVHFEATSSSSRQLDDKDKYTWEINGKEIVEPKRGITLENNDVEVPEFSVKLTVKREGAADVVVERKFAFSLMITAANPITEGENLVIIPRTGWAKLDKNASVDYELIDADGRYLDKAWDGKLDWNNPKPGESVYVKGTIDSNLFNGLKLGGSKRISLEEK